MYLKDKAAWKTERIKIKYIWKKKFKKMYYPCIETRAEIRRIRYNKKLNKHIQRSDFIKEISKKRLYWDTLAWRKLKSLVRIIIKEILSYKRPLGRQRLRWDDFIEHDMEKVEPDLQWRIAVIDRKTFVLRYDLNDQKN